MAAACSPREARADSLISASGPCGSHPGAAQFVMSAIANEGAAARKNPIAATQKITKKAIFGPATNRFLSLPTLRSRGFSFLKPALVWTVATTASMNWGGITQQRNTIAPVRSFTPLKKENFMWETSGGKRAGRDSRRLFHSSSPTGERPLPRRQVHLGPPYSRAKPWLGRRSTCRFQLRSGR